LAFTVGQTIVSLYAEAKIKRLRISHMFRGKWQELKSLLVNNRIDTIARGEKKYVTM